MNIKHDILMSKINLYIGSIFIFSFGLFCLTVGFKIAHLPDPLVEAITPVTELPGEF